MICAAPVRNVRTRRSRDLLTLLLAVAVAVAVAVTTAGAALQAQAADRAGQPGLADLQRRLDGLVAAGASGVIVRVDDGHRTAHLTSGVARLGSPFPLRPGARVRVGSITKTFTATVTLQLAAEGRLRLDDTVERWLPGLLPAGGTITVRHLLNHTSGLFNYTDDRAFLQAVQAEPTRRWAETELIRIATSRPPLFPPGQGWAYSNTGYVVLGLILEAAAGQPFERLVHRRIVRPLHLRDTLLPAVIPTIPGYHARGYFLPVITNGAGYADRTVISPTAGGAAGALISNVDDVRRFLRALLSGRLLPPAQLAEMTTTVPAVTGIRYGLGLYALQTPCGTVWGHDGAVSGYSAAAFADRSGRRGVTMSLPSWGDAAFSDLGTQTLHAAICTAFGAKAPASAHSAPRGSSDLVRYATLRP